ncbi:hypothetical protein [Leuconostoc pseudomesenteroides]|uniref:hypothetical protein n=1 Tax=Leuconostoc pseudomesenteroides TaxID=33968 RepID=UPI0032DF4B81
MLENGITFIMNKEILNYLDKIEEYYNNFKIESKAKKAEEYDSKKIVIRINNKILFEIPFNLHKILVPIIKINIFFSILMTFLINIHRDPFYGYTLFVLSTVIIFLSIASELNRKYELNKIYLNDFNKELDMEDMSKFVFCQRPSIQQLKYLKEIINERYQKNRTNRNVLITFLGFLIVILKPITDNVVQLFFKSEADYLSLIILIISILIAYWTLNRNSKLVQPDSWLIKDYENINQLENLINYLIYYS